MEPFYKYYKPAWRSFYRDFLLFFIVLIIAGVAHYFNAGTERIKWVWIAAGIIDLFILIIVAVKRSTMSLVLRDNPEKPEDQEVAFITCNPLKPFSSDFRKSIEIGLANIMHIEVRQTMMQTLFNIGNLIITSSGTDREEIRATNIPDPQAVRDEIQIHARKYTMGSNA